MQNSKKKQDVCKQQVPTKRIEHLATIQFTYNIHATMDHFSYCITHLYRCEGKT
ncbi:hypothetical protein Mapa_007525 [Marchantia paleacea]|nr:hypothetical protein Mapa_007525 [Marchantia paleacea]